MAVKSTGLPTNKMRIKNAVACVSVTGDSSFFLCEFEVYLSDLAERRHYAVAVEQAKDAGYRGPFVVFDSLSHPGLLDYLTEVDYANVAS